VSWSAVVDAVNEPVWRDSLAAMINTGRPADTDPIRPEDVQVVTSTVPSTSSRGNDRRALQQVTVQSLVSTFSPQIASYSSAFLSSLTLEQAQAGLQAAATPIVALAPATV
jgi:hypothetical protein